MRISIAAILLFTTPLLLLVLGGTLITGLNGAEPYYRDNTVIYPLLEFFHNRFSSYIPAALWIVNLGMAIHLRRTKRARWHVLLSEVSFLLFVNIGWQHFAQPNLEIFDQITHDESTYKLAWFSSYALGDDCEMLVFAVYQCDLEGILCTPYSTPYLSTYRDNACAGSVELSDNASFFVAENVLWVQIGQQKIRATDISAIEN